MTENKTVDIIIPIYNTPAILLKKCFESVTHQTYKNINAILVNDGSTNKSTIRVLRDYETTNSFQIHNQPNSGVSAARNLGLSKSSADYVYFLDSDDQIKQDHIKRLLEYAKKNKADIVFAGKEKNKYNDAPFKDHKLDIKRDSEVITIKAHAFASQGVLIKGSIARSERFTTTTTTTGEDTEYIIRIINKGKTYFEGLGGYIYSNNEAGITSNQSIKSVRKYLDESILLKNAFKKYLSISEETANIFLHLKMTRAFHKIANAHSYKISKNELSYFIKKNQIQKPNYIKTKNNKFLRKSEKILILLIGNNLFLPAYCIDKITKWLDGKKK